jgi:ABC-type multidrug transport system fused ATPase/permease subunit
MKAALRVLAPHVRGSRRLLLASLAAALAQAGLLVAIGLLVRRAFDREIPGNHVGALVVTGALLLCVALASGALAVWTRYLVLRAVKDAISRLRIALLERLNTLPASWFDRADAGTVHATVVQDTERLDVVANALAAQLAPALVISAGLSVALLVIDPLLFGILALSIPVLAVLTRRFDRVIRRRTRTWQLAFDRFSKRVLFAVNARPLIAAQAAEEHELEAGAADAVELGRAGRDMAWLYGVYAQLHGAVATLAAVTVLVVGGAAVARGNLSLGSLVSFYTLLALLRGQANGVLATLPQAISGRESLARLAAILDAPDRQPYRGTRKPSLEQSLALRDVHFGYVEGSPVLQGLTLELERGEWLALVGPNGSGKTTAAALLLGLYRPSRGTVEADGVPYDELDLHALRLRIGFVPQRPILFSASIAENIAYGERALDEGRVREAARLATVDELAGRLDDGYEARVGDDGDLLSGGERQRIAIARALLREPAVLVLDEPTSSLDGAAISRVLANLRTLAYRPAVLVITHDETLVDEADRVVSLGDVPVARPSFS